jgi:hypothetical protein
MSLPLVLAKHPSARHDRAQSSDIYSFLHDFPKHVFNGFGHRLLCHRLRLPELAHDPLGWRWGFGVVHDSLAEVSKSLR